MSGKIVEFSFYLWQSVKLLHVKETKGVVEGMMKDADGMAYKVRYWLNGERKIAWVRVDEIVSDNSVKKEE